MEKSRSGNGGQVLVIFALALLILMGFAALAIDVGHMYVVRNELQRSADSGALAGASAFQEGAWDNTDLTSPAMVLADARARDFASKDPVAQAPLDANGDVAVTFPATDRIRVTTNRTVNLSFARVLGMPTQAISATAVAEAAVVDQGVRCLKPWGIPLPWDDANGNGKYDPDETVYKVTDIPVGTKIILKVGEPFNNPNNLDNVTALQQEAGHFFALSPCGDSGGADYRARIESMCLDDCSIDNGALVDLKTGNTVGPTRQGVDGLIALDAGAYYDEIDHEVKNSAYADYMDSPRLVKVPLYNPSSLLSQGQTEMQVAAFGGFWLEGYDTQQGTVIGYYMIDVATGGSSTTGPAPGPQLRILRLVE